MTTPPPSERETFEAWVRENYTGMPEFRSASGVWAWAAWQAKAARAVPTPPVQDHYVDAHGNDCGKVHGPFSTTAELMTALNAPDDQCPCPKCVAPPALPGSQEISGDLSKIRAKQDRYGRVIVVDDRATPQPAEQNELSGVIAKLESVTAALAGMTAGFTGGKDE